MALTAQITGSAALPPAGTDSISQPEADSVVVDSVAHDTTYCILLEAPERPGLAPRSEAEGGGMSWIIGALTLLFVVAAIRYRNNSKYLSAMFRDAVEVRERGNVFDETVREKSFVIMLNLLWCMSVGVLLYTLVVWSSGRGMLQEAAGALRAVPEGGYAPGLAPAGMAICIGAACLWQMLMVGAYWMVAYVFSDTFHARMWVNGYLATTGLSTLVFFPLSLTAIFYPADAGIILPVALGGLIMAKLMFIWKGFRIFFKEITSWLLFLYYLCSLEIVPLILLYFSTVLLCGTLL